MAENRDVFDFEISSEDMQLLVGCNHVIMILGLPTNLSVTEKWQYYDIITH